MHDKLSVELPDTAPKSSAEGTDCGGSRETCAIQNLHYQT